MLRQWSAPKIAEFDRDLPIRLTVFAGFSRAFLPDSHLPRAGGRSCQKAISKPLPSLVKPSMIRPQS
jgi:hypothetical protein